MTIVYLDMIYGLICPVHLLLWVTDMWSSVPHSLWDLATTCPDGVTTIWAPFGAGGTFATIWMPRVSVSVHSAPLRLYPPNPEIFTSHGVLISSTLTPSISAVFLSPFDHLTCHGVCLAGEGCPSMWWLSGLFSPCRYPWPRPPPPAARRPGHCSLRGYSKLSRMRGGAITSAFGRWRQTPTRWRTHLSRLLRQHHCQRLKVTYELLFYVHKVKFCCYIHVPLYLFHGWSILDWFGHCWFKHTIIESVP